MLLRSDVVEIQVRYEPIGDDSAVSVHTAVAAGFDGHRVTIDAGGVSIDGVRDDELSGDRQLDGGSVAWQPFAGTAVRFPDGTTMRVVGASIWIEASEALFADGVGLLAAGAGPSGLPPTPAAPEGDPARAPERGPAPGPGPPPAPTVRPIPVSASSTPRAEPHPCQPQS